MSVVNSSTQMKEVFDVNNAVVPNEGWNLTYNLQKM